MHYKWGPMSRRYMWISVSPLLVTAFEYMFTVSQGLRIPTDLWCMGVQQDGKCITSMTESVGLWQTQEALFSVQTKTLFYQKGGNGVLRNTNAMTFVICYHNTYSDVLLSHSFLLVLFPNIIQPFMTKIIAWKERKNRVTYSSFSFKLFLTCQ